MFHAIVSEEKLTCDFQFSLATLTTSHFFFGEGGGGGGAGFHIRIPLDRNYLTRPMSGRLPDNYFMITGILL